MVNSIDQVTLAGSPMAHRCHACAFFHSPEDEYRLLLPFAKEGYEQRHKIVQFVDKRKRTDLLRRFADIGIDTISAEQSGQIEILPWENTYLRDHRFDQYAMLALIEETLSNGDRLYGMTRLWANMEWSLLDFPGSDDLIAYETLLNDLTSRYDDVVVCTYDLNRFNAAVVMDVLRTHPQVIVGGLLLENPFFIPPEQLLIELRSRQSPVH